MTVHRDLDALEGQGWLSKIRGGATANPSALVEAGVRERSNALRAEKQAIAAAAKPLQLLVGQSIMMLVVLAAVVAFLNRTSGVGWMFVFFVALVVVMNYALTRTKWGRSGAVAHDRALPSCGTLN